MSTTEDILVADLQLDLYNPRQLSDNCRDQTEALHSITRRQGNKIRRIAQDILDEGMNPSVLPIVVPTEDDTDQYVVLDGNRRLAALKLLENPSLLPDDTANSMRNAFENMSATYLEDPIEIITCSVFDDRAYATHWVELAHIGEAGGAGTVRWGSDEKSKYSQDILGLPPSQSKQALDLLERIGSITSEHRITAPTTLGRILSNPTCRAAMGLDLENGQLIAVGEIEGVAKALLYVVQAIHSGTIHVSDVYTAEQREAFGQNLPSEIAVTSTADEPTPLKDIQAPTAEPQAQSTPESSNQQTQPKPRTMMIPKHCTLNIPPPRIRAIERELRRLNLNTAPNAIGVLLRVFVELSLDNYILKANLQVSSRPKLREKLLKVVQELVAQKAINTNQAAPVRRAAQKDSFLNPSVDLQHAWVHNEHVTPVGSELRSHWDDLQPFVEAIWA